MKVRLPWTAQDSKAQPAGVSSPASASPNGRTTTKAGYHHDGGILPFTIVSDCSRALFSSCASPPHKQKIPRQMSEDFCGGELGTRTPDPLRVMHDDFLIFGAIIRQIDEICYRSATNGSMKS